MIVNVNAEKSNTLEQDGQRIRRETQKSLGRRPRALLGRVRAALHRAYRSKPVDPPSASSRVSALAHQCTVSGGYMFAAAPRPGKRRRGQNARRESAEAPKGAGRSAAMNASISSAIVVTIGSMSVSVMSRTVTDLGSGLAVVAHREAHQGLPSNLERETRLELATPTLARSCSTN